MDSRVIVGKWYWWLSSSLAKAETTRVVREMTQSRINQVEVEVR
jgi:hypothetical protein